MLNPSGKIRVVFSVTNCICFDQRVLKIAETVSQLNCEVTIIGRVKGDCCESDSIPFDTHRFRMLFRRGFLFYMFFNIRLFFFLLFNRYDILVANDLDTLLPNYIIAAIKRLPLVYDSHEYFTEVPELQGRPFVRGFWSLIEKRIFPRLKYIMTVSDSISAQYENKYKVKARVVRNCARSVGGLGSFTKSDLGIKDDHLLMIMQGGGINIERGAEELIEAVNSLEKVFLIIAGSGDVIESLKEKVLVNNISDKIRFIPKQPWPELMKYTISADAGLTLDRDTNLNYRFSLPNKLFDYIAAGIPVIAGDLPEVSRIITDYQCGIIIKQITPGEIRTAIDTLQNDRDLLNKLKLNAISASRILNWDSEKSKVLDFYKEIISNKILIFGGKT